jgi:formylglycine-generating enzyme required for sulfatase activity/tRNA A-37 threonylcarbamoyl transferase component Bud32
MSGSNPSDGVNEPARAPLGATPELDADTRALADRLQRALGAPYSVTQLLGSGGFASVFRVHDGNLHRDLAVKVLNPELLASGKTRERFQREAEIVAKLSHPNVVHVHFIGGKDDLLYIAMPCVSGGTLADRIAREGALPLGEAVRVMSQVTAAVAHAHKRGVLHRDIKTANVLYDDEGDRYLLSDFGIARGEDSAALTSTGLVIGSPAYLSPEQISGDAADHRADIYAMGVLSYEVLTGRLPFEGTTSTAAMMKRFEGPPVAPSALRGDVPPFLDAVVARCLELDPAARFQSADELLHAIEGGTTGETAYVRTGAKSARVGAGPRAVSRGAIAAVVLVLIAGLAYFPMRALQRRSAATLATADSTLVGIPAGRYTIGSNTGPANARPAREVTLGAYHIGTHETTVREYQTVMALTVPIPADRSAALPVTGRLWTEAVAYCAKRYAGGRLPTEEEWEAAARAAPLGARDLLGSVWEWTASPFVGYPGNVQEVRTTGAYVIRGGAVGSPDSVRVPWFRAGTDAAGPREALAKTGFRCAVSDSAASAR